VVGAILAGFVRSGLTGAGLATVSGPVDPATLTLAAQRLAMGDLAQAAAALPQAGPALLVQAYGDAFHGLLFVLAAITVVSAVVVFGFLSRAVPIVEPELVPAAE